jgi:hypothetical protein
MKTHEEIKQIFNEFDNIKKKLEKTKTFIDKAEEFVNSIPDKERNLNELIKAHESLKKQLDESYNEFKESTNKSINQGLDSIKNGLKKYKEEYLDKFKLNIEQIEKQVTDFKREISDNLTNTDTRLSDRIKNIDLDLKNLVDKKISDTRINFDERITLLHKSILDNIENNKKTIESELSKIQREIDTTRNEFIQKTISITDKMNRTDKRNMIIFVLLFILILTAIILNFIKM